MRVSATDRAYEWLHSAILAGDIPGGAFVDEASVCEATGVSRTPVREAFHRLAGERFIELVPRRGAKVRVLGLRDLVEVYEARWVLESAAIKRLLQREGSAIRAVTQQMVQVLEEMERTTGLESADVQLRYIGLDKAFHGAYVTATDNSVLVDFYDRLWPMHEWSVLRGRTGLSNFLDTINAEHRQIFEGVRRGDEDAVLSALSGHLHPFTV
jgi:DNA-binding GntR family transcriptional regulator